MFYVCIITNVLLCIMNYYVINQVENTHVNNNDKIHNNIHYTI